MNIPRWLLIVGIVIVVLGVLACGIGAGKTLTEPPARSNEPARKELDIFPVLPVAGRDVVMTGSCTRSDLASGTRFTGTHCILTVTPSGFLPHELKLRLDAGSGTMTVSQELRGDPHSSTKAIPASEALRVRVAGSSPVTTELTCIAQCPVTVVTE